MSEIRKALEEALALFDKNHALDHFDWGKSFLNANDIKELNELPGKLREALTLLSPEGETRGPYCRDGCGPCRDEPGPWHQRGCVQWRALIQAAEPAPSSEKALIERCEALAKRWDSETGRESFAPVFAEELREALASSPAPEAPKEQEQFPACVGCKRDGLQRRVGLCQDCGRHIKPDYYERSATT